MALLAKTPDSALLAELRESQPLEDATVVEGLSSWLRSLQALYLRRRHKPWLGEHSRAMLDMPFAPPYNSSAVVRAPLVAPLVEMLLGAPRGGGLGVVVEQAAHIMVGPRTGPQQMHTDAAHYTVVGEAVAVHPVTSLVEEATAADDAAKAAFDAIRTDMERGARTYALNVQMPLTEVTMANGPTALCPATHSEAFCKAFLGGICKPRQHAAGVSAVEAIAAYASTSRSCAPGTTRVHGTAAVGDILLYDSRLIHGGAAHTTAAGGVRSIISFTYAHGWYTEAGRDLSPAAVAEALPWRDVWPREQRAAAAAAAGDAPPVGAIGALSAARFRDIHNGLREFRQREERIFLTRKIVGYAILLYGIYSFSGRRRLPPPSREKGRKAALGLRRRQLARSAVEHL